MKLADDGKIEVRACPYCGGDGLNPLYSANQGRCPVCHGKGRTAHCWNGDEFVPLNPDEVEQRVLI